MSAEGPFQRKAFFDQPELIGARWWHESMALADVSRRKLLQNLGLLVVAADGVGGIGYAIWRAFARTERITGPSIDIQRDRGWNLGAGSIDIPFAQETDARGNADWRKNVDRLAHELSPHNTPVVPYYVPTLFGSLSEPANESLRNAMRPMRSPPMDAAEGVGRALMSILRDRAAKNLAVIVDLSGPESVAFAAGACALLDTVFVFDNWPHPLGVVPSQQTLAATINYFPTFRETSPDRTADAPPLFILDRNRLNPYGGSANQFDNRYVARLPPVAGFKTLGIQHVLYITPDAKAIELDDLNADFVALASAGIEIMTLAVTDPPAWSSVRTHQPVTRSTIFNGVGPEKKVPNDFAIASVDVPPDSTRPAVGPTSRPHYGLGPSYKPYYDYGPTYGPSYGGGGGSGGSWGRGGGGGGG